MSEPNDRDKWINLSVIHEKEIYNLQVEIERLVNLVAYLKQDKPFTKHEDDIRRGLRTK